jgi:hypothetical protein
VVKLSKDNFLGNAHVVCILTGMGFKYSATVFRVTGEPIKVDAEVKAVEKALEGIL